MRKYLLLFALLTLVLAACRLETNVTLDIAEDGSATVGAEVGFDDEFKDLIEQSGASVDDIFGDLPSFGDGETETTERTEGDMTFYGAVTEVDDLSSFDMGSAQGEVFSSFAYTFDDASANLDATLASADLGDVGGDLPIDPSQITSEFFSANVIVKMPGNVTESNADEVRSDGSLVWNIPFTGTKEITATSEFGSSTANWILFILIGVLIIGVIAAVVAMIVSRKESRKAVETAASSHEAAKEPVLDDTPTLAVPDASDEHGIVDDASRLPAAGAATAATEMTSEVHRPSDAFDATIPTDLPESPVADEGDVSDHTIEETIDDDADAAESTWDSEGGQPDRT